MEFLPVDRHAGYHQTVHNVMGPFGVVFANDWLATLATHEGEFYIGWSRTIHIRGKYSSDCASSLFNGNVGT
jgi:hypothetical protein